MKNLVLHLLLLSSGICHAQMYSPAASEGLLSGMMEQPYSTVISVSVPQQVSMNTSIFGDPIVVPGLPFPIPNPNMDLEATVTTVALSLSGLPAGLTYSCSAANCSFAAGSSGTVTISGTPTAGGTFTVNIVSQTDGSASIPAIGVMPFPQPIPGAFDESGYQLSVFNPNSIGENDVLRGLRVMAADRPDQAVMELEATRAMRLTVMVTDIQGRVISKLGLDVMEGGNRFSIPMGDAPGIHVITVQGGDVNAVLRHMRR